MVVEAREWTRSGEGRKSRQLVKKTGGKQEHSACLLDSLSELGRTVGSGKSGGDLKMRMGNSVIAMNDESRW